MSVGGAVVPSASNAARGSFNLSREWLHPRCYIQREGGEGWREKKWGEGSARVCKSDKSCDKARGRESERLTWRESQRENSFQKG